MKKNNRINHIISKLRTNKRVIIVVGDSLLLLSIVFGVLFLSQRLWGDYETNYSRRFDIAKTDINKAILQNISTTDANLKEKSDNITKIQVKLTKEINTYCEVNPLIKWQSFIGNNSTKINECNKKRDNLSALLLDIGNLTVYLKSEQKLSAIIISANVNTNKNNKAEKWEKIEAFWRQAIADVSKLTDVKYFIITEKLAVSKLDGVADAWQQLSSANKAKNRQKFEESQVNLGNAYKGLSKISENSKVQVKNLISNINNSYKSAF